MYTGHVSFNLSPIISLFLRRDVSQLELLEGKYIEELDMGLKCRMFTNLMEQSLVLTSHESDSLKTCGLV